MCHDSYCTYRIEAMVERGFRHRLYNPMTMAYDIAILRLYRKVQYTGCTLCRLKICLLLTLYPIQII